MSRLLNWLSPFALIFALAFVGTQLDRPLLNLLTLTLAAMTLAHAWNIFGGYTGYVDLGQMAFVGVGAYSVGALMTQTFDFTQALIVALMIGAVTAAVTGLLILRLRGALFTLATLALLALAHEITSSTRLYLPTTNDIYNVILLLWAGAWLLSIWVFRSQYGLMLRAIREDETGANTRGINTLALKLIAFTLVGALAAGVGAAQTYWQGALPESTFALVLAITLVGGLGRPWGPIVGGVLFLIVQFVIPNPELQMMLAGGSILAVLFFLPNGILGIVSRHKTDSQPDAPIALSSERIAELLAQPDAGETRVVLEGRSITHDFGGLRVVNKASFWVRRGEIVGLLGPNGAGKSTLLDCITGILKPSSGDIFLNGQEITRLPPWQVNRYGLGRTFERTRLFEGLTVHENMLLAQKWRGVPLHLWLTSASTDAQRRADELLTLIGLGAARSQRAGDLSTIDQRLLEISMALMSAPSIILLDEITAGLPLATIGELKTTLRQLNHDFGLTFFIVEHNMHFAVDLCHRVYVLDHGSIVAEGAPNEIQSEPAVADAYFGHE